MPNDNLPLRQRLTLLVESNLHYLAREPMTREEAMDMKERFSRAIGILSSRHGLGTQGERKEQRIHRVQQNTVVKTVKIS